MVYIMYGLLLAHLNSYRHYYTSIGITFAITYLMKRMIKSGGSKEHSELIGLGGYTLTIGEFVKLLGAVKKNGVKISAESDEILGGVLGKGLDSLKDLFTK